MSTAVVFGANGISGSAVVEELLRSNLTKTFSKVIAISRKAECYGQPDPRKLYASIDTLSRPEAIARAIQAQLCDDLAVSKISHLYYFAYVRTDAGDDEKEKNLRMLRNSILGVELAIEAARSNVGSESRGLEMIVLQTGAKAYGTSVLGKLLPDGRPFSLDNTVLVEDLPRVPASISHSIFYYEQCDLLLEMQKTRPWRWIETRPDAIIGLVPGGNSNAMTTASAYAVYLSVRSEMALLGTGSSTVTFTGDHKGFGCRKTWISNDQIAKASIHLSLLSRSELKGTGHVFNISNGDIFSFEQHWEGMVGQFEGLKADTVPNKGGVASISEQMATPEAKAAWEHLVLRKGLRYPDLFRNMGFWMADRQSTFPYDTVLSIDKIRSTGFVQTEDTAIGILAVWAHMRKERYI